MIDFCAFVFPQPDEQHFQHTTLDVTGKLRVRFDTVRHNDVISGERELVEMYRKTFGRPADNNRFHSCLDLAPAVCFSDPVRLDDLLLARRCATAVAAHGRHQERFGTQRFDVIDDRLDDFLDIGDATAADGNRHGLARLDPLAKCQVCQL